MPWLESDGEQLWLVRWWGGESQIQDDDNDRVRCVVVACERPEDAIEAVRKFHDEFAQFRSVRRIQCLEERPDEVVSLNMPKCESTSEYDQ